MKTIGLIGGMSWESTAEYYRIINQRVSQKLGDGHSAKIVMVSIDFFELHQLAMSDHWSEATAMMIDSAKKLELCGADCLLICANTMHKIAKEVQENIKIPLIHIADKTAEKIKEAGIKKIGLTGTQRTMQESFYRDRLKEKYNIDSIVPDEKERDIIQEIIFKELCLGKIRKESKERLKIIIESLGKKGAQGVILGCTEIPLLIQPADSNIPLFDTTRIHAEAAADYALS